MSIADVFYYGHYKWLNVSNKYIIDIGAYIGDSAIYFALKGARKVFAVEPYPYTYDLLVKNIKINSLNSIIKPINAAITDKNGVTLLPYLVEDTSDKSVHGSDIGVEVPCYKLSSLIDMLKDIEKVNGDLALKMDCEGCEYNVILGSSNETLRVFEEIILELHGDPKPLIYKLKESCFKVKVKVLPLKQEILYAKQKNPYLA